MIRLVGRPLVLTAAALAINGVLGVASEALAQAPPPVRTCEPWVSHAFNNALANKVDRARNNYKTPVDPCEDKLTAYETVAEFKELTPNGAVDEEASAETRMRALRIRLNEVLIVRVQHLQTLLDRANCTDRAKTQEALAKSGGTAAPVTVSGCSKRDIRLFIDGRPIGGLLPESGAPDVQRNSGTLRYHLERTPQSSEHWADLLGLDLQQTSKFDRYVRVSVGLGDSDPIPTAVTGFQLVRIRGAWLVVWLVLAVLALTVVYFWASRTDLLRDRNPIVEHRQKRPFSLAQCQAAWWTILTLLAFVFIWLVTGQRDFSGSALTLLGITAGTVLGARIIDSTREDPAAPTDPAKQLEVKAALDEKARLEQELIKAEVDVASKPQDQPALGALKQAREQYEKHVAETRRKHPGLVTQRSEGLLVDLLSDSTGVSFHRFQMVAWAAILGVIFVIGVLARLAMPEFDANLLGLLGISSGTYLGLKVPEKP